MNLNIRFAFAPDEDTQLISVEAYTIFEVAGYKFFSHHPINNSAEIISDQWKCSEYSTGLAITWGEYPTEKEAIEGATVILEQRKEGLAWNLKAAIENYGIANPEEEN